MLSKIKQVIKLIFVRLKILVKQRDEFYQFKRLKLEEQITLDQAIVRAHIVGCGAMGRHIARVIASVNKWRVISVFDVQGSAMKKLESTLGYDVKKCRSIDEIFDEVRGQDILVIATTAKTHFEIARKAIQIGIKKIFLEKPVCTSLIQANELISLSITNDSLIYVDHLRRWSTASESVKRLVESKVIGKIVMINYFFGRSGFAMIGSHLFDFARWITSSDIKCIRGILDDIKRPNWRGEEFHDPSGFCDATMTNGVRVYIDLSDSLEIQQDICVILCERGRIEIDQRIERIRLVGPAGVIWENDFPWNSMLQFGIANSLYELASNLPARCNVHDGKAALEAVIAVHESNKLGGAWIELPLQGDILNRNFEFA